jgi:hypothetical protein
MVFCVERVDVARIASKSAFLNMIFRLPLPLILGKSESQVVLVFFAQGEGGFIPFGSDTPKLASALIPFGSDTPKLASALMRVKMGNGESIYTQKTQCFGADVSLGVCC